MPKINRGRRPAVISEGRGGTVITSPLQIVEVVGTDTLLSVTQAARKAADIEAATPITAGRTLAKDMPLQPRDDKPVNPGNPMGPTFGQLFGRQPSPVIQWVEGIDALIGPMTDDQKSTLVAVGVRTSPADRDAILGILRKCLGSKK